jgi:SH3-like domain-containing protein
MKRKFVWMLLFALALGGLLMAEAGTTFKVKVATANVRSKADASAPVIAKVTAGTVLKVYGKESAWYEVGVNSKAGEEVYGFIHNTMGEIRGEEGEETAEAEKTEKVEKKEEKAVVAASQEVVKARSAQPAKEIMTVKVKVQTAIVRSEPDAASALIARVPAGALLGVTSHAGDWYEVNMNDESGKATTGFIRDTVVNVVGADGDEIEEEEEKEYVPSRPVSPNRSYSRPTPETSMHFGINFGAMTDDTFTFDPFLWTAGAELDFQFGSFLMLSPEVMLVGSGFEFKEFILYPAAILNFTASSFFVGGGVAKGFLIGSGATGSTDFLLKVNAGLVAPGVKLTVYALTAFDNLFNDMLLGASLGFRF